MGFNYKNKASNSHRQFHAIHFPRDSKIEYEKGKEGDGRGE